MASVQAADDVGLQLSGGKAFHGGQQGAQGWGSGLWPAQLQAGAADDSLITPTNAEAPLLLSGGGGGSGARAAPQCLLCGGLGTSAVCGALRPATYEGQPAVVHHLCAVWSPGCFQREVGAGVLYAAVPCTTCLDAFPPPRSCRPTPPPAGLLSVCQPGGGGAPSTQPLLQRVRADGRVAAVRPPRVRLWGSSSLWMSAAPRARSRRSCLRLGGADGAATVLASQRRAPALSPCTLPTRQLTVPARLPLTARLPGAGAAPPSTCPAPCLRPT